MATFKSDMLNYRYEASLHIHHPSIEPQSITAELPFAPERTHRKHDARTAPNGSPLSGTWSDNYWNCGLQTEDQVDVSAFLAGLVITLEPCRAFLKHLAATGGEVCVILGLFSHSCCAHQLNNQLLTDIADTGLDLRLDFYAAESTQ